jgi:dTDP-glucose 4,6-dehydratase
MNSNVLVTGGAGFIGANFVRHWCAVRPQSRVTVLDALTYAGNFSSIADLSRDGRIAFVHGDIRDFELVSRTLEAHEIDTIVHFAAESHVDRSIAGPAIFVSTNVIGTQTLLDAARAVWLDGRSEPRPHRFHHVSTDEVYGSLEHTDAPFTESSPYAPSSPYAASKAAADHIVRAYARTYGIQCTISNCSNNYGPYQFPEKLIPLCIINMLEGKPLPIYGKGQNVRDWLHVQDHCRAIERILLAGRAGETWNVGGLAECANLDLVGRLCAAMDRAFAADPALAARFPRSPAARGEACAGLIRFVADRPGHDFRYAIDPRRIAADLGVHPSIVLDEGLRQTLEWYLANESWWRAVMDGSYQDWIRRHYGERDHAPPT